MSKDYFALEIPIFWRALYIALVINGPKQDYSNSHMLLMIQIGNSMATTWDFQDVVHIPWKSRPTTEIKETPILDP